MKQNFKFEFDFDKINSINVNCALRINKAQFYEELRSKVISVSQQIVLEYATSKLTQDEIIKKEEIKKTIEVENFEQECDSAREPNISSITYKFADKEWKRKAIDAVIEASKQNITLTPNEIFKIVGISLSLKNRFRRSLGALMKKSGIKCKKSSMYGTTVTEYFI